jgi:hypothetical protein
MLESAAQSLSRLANKGPVFNNGKSARLGVGFI